MGGGRMDGRTNKSPPVFYRTSSPSGPLPCFLLLQFKIMESRATGIADHILPFGDLLDLILPYRLQISLRTLALWGCCPALTSLLFLITLCRALGPVDHVQSLED